MRDAGRVALATVAAAYALVAVVLWARPEAVAELGPVDAGPLGVRFVGSWAAFLALLAAGVVVRPRWAESRLALAALVTWPLVVLAAVLPHLDALRAGAPTWAYLAALPAAGRGAGGDAGEHAPTRRPPRPDRGDGASGPRARGLTSPNGRLVGRPVWFWRSLRLCRMLACAPNGQPLEAGFRPSPHRLAA